MSRLWPICFLSSIQFWLSVTMIFWHPRFWLWRRICRIMLVARFGPLKGESWSWHCLDRWKTNHGREVVKIRKMTTWFRPMWCFDGLASERKLSRCCRFGVMTTRLFGTDLLSRVTVGSWTGHLRKVRSEL